MILKQAITSTFFLKATSLIIGFLLWSIISNSCTTHTWITVPVCFYNKTNELFSAPATVLVELKAKRSFLRQLDRKNLAVHINAHTLQKGPNTIQLSSDLLFLPPSISIGEIIPHNILITVQEGHP